MTQVDSLRRGTVVPFIALHKRTRALSYPEGVLDAAVADLLEWAKTEGITRKEAIEDLYGEIAAGRTFEEAPGRPRVYHLDLIDRLAEWDCGAGPSIGAALSLWSAWFLDFPPTGATGDTHLDLRLAYAFRVLAAMGDDQARLRWIERRVFTTSDFPAPDRPGNRYRATLIAWWLAIHDCSAV